MKSDLILPPPPQQLDKECQTSVAVSCAQRQNYSADYLAPLECFVYLVAELKLWGITGMESFIAGMCLSESCTSRSTFFELKQSTQQPSVKQKHSELLTPPSESPLPQGRLQQTDQYSSVFRGLPTQATCHERWETGATAVCGATMTS